MAVAILVKLPICLLSFDFDSCRTKPVCESAMIKACAAKDERITPPSNATAATTKTRRRGKITGVDVRRQDGGRCCLVRNHRNANSYSSGKLMLARAP